MVATAVLHLAAEDSSSPTGQLSRTLAFDILASLVLTLLSSAG